MKILKLKATIRNNTLEGFDRRMEMTEEKISELEDTSVETTQHKKIEIKKAKPERPVGQYQKF